MAEPHLTRPLSFSDVQDAIKRAPSLQGIVLVGGQALNYWADYFGIVTKDSEHIYGAALSADIDFLGGADAAKNFAAATGGRARIAGIEDAHSPNTAMVMLEIGSEMHAIDFLGSLKGFTHTELKRVMEWATQIRLEDGAGPALSVLHPVHCLESQLENVYGTALDRRASAAGERHARRVRLAVEVCRQTVLEHLGSDRTRNALKIAEKLHELSCAPNAMRARFEDGLHIEDAVPAGAMPQAFQDERWPRMTRELEAALTKHERSLSRRP